MMFSIVVPVFNVHAYVEKCIQSVCAQTYGQWELICVDDGSNDGSGAVVEEWTRRDPRIRLVKQTNAGVSAARNAGMDVARGDWLLFLDADDAIDSNLLERLDERLTNDNQLDAIGFGVEFVDEGGRRLGLFNRAFDSVVCSGDAILRDYRGMLGPFGWIVCNKAFRRQLIKEHGLRFAVGMKNHEDSLFSQIFLSYAGAVALIPNYFAYKYLVREGSAVNHRRGRLPDDPFRQFRELHSRWRECRLPGLLMTLKYLAAQFLYLGIGDGFGECVRDEAVEMMLGSSEFNRQIIPFLVWHGTLKARFFAVGCLLLPKALRRTLLKAL